MILHHFRSKLMRKVGGPTLRRLNSAALVRAAAIGLIEVRNRLLPHQLCHSYYADRVWGANGDLDLLELIDGRSYKLQCRSSYRTR